MFRLTRVRRSGHQQGGTEGRRTLLRWEQPGGRAKRRCTVCLGVGEEEAADWFRWRQVIGWRKRVCWATGQLLELLQNNRIMEIQCYKMIIRWLHVLVKMVSSAGHCNKTLIKEMIPALHTLLVVIFQLVKSMFPDLWLAQLPLVLCFFPPWVPSWSPLISANLPPLVTSHPHGFTLSVSLWTPSELLFWTLKCILAARCDWLSARSANVTNQKS